MKVAFPYFGLDTIAIKNFLETLGAEVRMPALPTEKTITLGTKYSPELICLPFKITLGNFIEAIEAGADTLFMAAGAKKCRFGYYHFIQETILKKLGKDVKFYPISQYTPFEFIFQKMPEIFSVKPVKVMYAIYVMLKHSALIDYLRQLSRKARTINFLKSTKAEQQALNIIKKAKTISQINKARKKIKSLFDFSDNENVSPLKIGLVGEIYLMLEPFANHDIEKELGKMGVWVWNERSLYSHLKHLLRIDWRRYIRYHEARAYLKESPGGEALNTVGEARSFIKKGADGIIHIFPFTCMPENIALEALQKMSEDYSVPVLSLSIDEHTSKTGLLTRLEAFVDLIKRRKLVTQKLEGNSKLKCQNSKLQLKTQNFK
jgi:predicted nucleotide-binding protein (sugar kinase/HSP70/actin superfamily)